MKCPHCGEEIIVKGKPGGAEKIVEIYYRSRAAGSCVTMTELAQMFGYSPSWLSQAKAAYDAAGKWGSTGEVASKPRHGYARARKKVKA